MRTLNIGNGFSDLRARELSNFPPRPFILDDVKVESVEGFVQGTKYPPGDPRREQAFATFGVKAKRLGENADRQFVWWNNRMIIYGSKGHHQLIERAIRASFEQNPIALTILYSTRGMTLIHDLGTPESPFTSLPAAVFCDILTRLRDEGDQIAHRARVEEQQLIQTLSLADCQDAARMIEIDDFDAYRSVAKKYGVDVANVLIVAHFRRAFGSVETYQPDPDINEKIRAALEQHSIHIP